jgi:hypothetical protein
MADGYTSLEFQRVREAVLACSDADRAYLRDVGEGPLKENEPAEASPLPNSLGAPAKCRGALLFRKWNDRRV